MVFLILFINKLCSQEYYYKKEEKIKDKKQLKLIL